MTRDELKAIIGEITDEQLKAIMDLNGKDVNKAKAKGDELAQQVTELKDTIATLETAKGDTEKLQAELDKFKLQEQERIANEEKARAEADMVKRFDAVVGETKFINELTKQGIYGQWKSHVADANNTGKGDKEIYEEIVKDAKDIFAPANEMHNMSGMGDNGDENIDGVTAHFLERNPNIKL